MIGPISQTNGFGGLLNEDTPTLINNEELKNIITQLEADIEDGSWPHKIYSSTDMKIMPALVAQANNKFPEMNLNFIKSPQDLSLEIKNKIDNGAESSKFIINMGDKGIHFSVIDYKHINGKTSLILFEPANFNSMGPAMLALRTKIAIERYQLPDCHFSMVEMDIQRSSSECGIFSLALAKKLYTERNELLKIHEDNINGTLTDSETPLPHDKLDPYLPVTFYKHTQGKKRLDEYLNTNPQGAATVINKKMKLSLTGLIKINRL
ncbi:YopP, also called YopJ, interferes with signalling, PMID 18413260 [Edwardsiella anguillarum]|nr:YopP, also called YopJ, interferes with signalling, PMID 18413260 [Edwardsiella anguillarum]